MKQYTIYEVVAINSQGGISFAEAPQGYSKYYERLNKWHAEGLPDTWEVYGLEQVREHFLEVTAKYPTYHYAIRESVVSHSVPLFGWYAECSMVGIELGNLVHFTEWKQGEYMPFFDVIKVDPFGDGTAWYLRRLSTYDQNAMDAAVEKSIDLSSRVRKV